MAIQTTYTNGRSRLASLIDEGIENSEIVIISQRGREDVAMIAANELAGLLETAHLLRSSANAKRIYAALERVRKREVLRRLRHFEKRLALTSKTKLNKRREAVFQPEFREEPFVYHYK